MKARDIIAKKGSAVYTGSPSHTIKDALHTLLEHKVGALVIVDEAERPVGIISEKDILHLAHKHDNWRDLIVGDHMTEKLIIGLPGCPCRCRADCH